ncbi:MAG: hypothetical protein U9O87_09660 [Verrucomicrobiota bacterium]|nr:hypothetical protein [Verrucomicrobiota bacterium]
MILKKYIKLSIKTFIWILLALILVVFSGIVYVEIYGLPRFCIDTLEDYFSTKGLFIEAEEIKVGLFRGVTIDKITFFDSVELNEPIFWADRLELNPSFSHCLSGNLGVKSFALKNGKIILKLQKDSRKILKVMDIQLRAKKEHDNYNIHNLSFKIDNIHFQVNLLLTNAVHYFMLQHTLSKAKKTKKNIQIELSLRKVLDFLPAKTIKNISSYIDFYKNLDFSKDAEIKIKAEMKCFFPKSLTASASFSFPELLCDGLPVNNLSGKMSLEKNKIDINELNCAIDHEEFINCDIHYNLLENSLTVDCKGKIYPKKILKTFKIPIKKSFVDNFDFMGAAPIIELHLNSSVIGEKDWMGEGHIVAEKTFYNNIFFNDAEGDFSFKKGVYEFSNVKALVNNDIPIEFSAMILPKCHDVFMDAKILGNPDFIAGFLKNPSHAKHYRKIWTIFKPTKGNPIKLNASMLIKNFNLPLKDREFVLVGQAVMPRVRLNKVPFDFLYSTIIFNSAAGQAKVHYLNTLAANKTGNFRCNAVSLFSKQEGHNICFSGKGKIDPFTVLPAFVKKTLPGKDEKKMFSLQNIDLSNGSELSCEGFVDLDNPSKTNFSAVFETKGSSILSLLFRKISCNVSYRSNLYRINDFAGKIYGGHVNGEFEQISEELTKIDFSASKIILAKLSDFLKSDKLKEMKGELSLELDILSAENGEINGTGTLHIKKAEFWKIPIFDGLFSILSKIIPLKSSSEITKLDADLNFKGHKVMVTNLRTDGRVLALTGGGIYNMKTKEIDFVLQTRPLKELLWGTIPALLTPLTNMLEINLKGTPDNLKWKQLGSLRKLWPFSKKDEKKEKKKEGFWPFAEEYNEKEGKND